MRLSKICRQLLDVDPLIADDVEFLSHDLIFHVRPVVVKIDVAFLFIQRDFLAASASPGSTRRL